MSKETDALIYAIEILESEAEIRDNDDTGNCVMKRHTKVLKRLLKTVVKEESREGEG